MIAFFKTILYNPLYNILMFFVWLTPGHSMGVAIIILTLIIRFALLPLSLKGARAQVKLQALQPKINKLRKEIKDQQLQGKALMALYKKEGVSPFGSCLLLLVQLPIIVVLYQVFRAGMDSSQLSLLYSFVPHPSSINFDFLGVNLANKDLWAYPIIAGLTQLYLSILMIPAGQSPLGGAKQKKSAKKDEAPDAMSMANKQMMYIFPVMTFLFARAVPAALSLYWIVTTVFSIIQQLYINKNIKHELEMAEEEIEEADVDIEELADEYSEKKSGPSKEIGGKPKKKDLYLRMMDKKLKKQEKKTGVEISIRTKE